MTETPHTPETSTERAKKKKQSLVTLQKRMNTMSSKEYDTSDKIRLGDYGSDFSDDSGSESDGDSKDEVHEVNVNVNGKSPPTATVLSNV